MMHLLAAGGQICYSTRRMSACLCEELGKKGLHTYNISCRNVEANEVAMSIYTMAVLSTIKRLKL